jgi:hypothetical protein
VQILYVVTDDESLDRARIIEDLMTRVGRGRAAPGDSTEIAGPAALLMLVASAAATLVVAVSAGAVAAAATGDESLFVVVAVCGSFLGIAWLGVSMTIAASRDMAMALQLGLLVTCPLVPILVAAFTVAGHGGAVVILTVVVIAGLLLAMRKLSQT